jgi:hypothetical protein
MCEQEDGLRRSRLGELRSQGSQGGFNTSGGRSEFDTRPQLLGPDGRPIIKEKPTFGFGS